MIATFPIDNCGPIFQPAHKVKFDVDPNYMLFPSIVYSFSFMIPVIHNCFRVPTSLFSRDRLDILYGKTNSTCTSSRSEEYQNKKWETNDRKVEGCAQAVWCGVLCGMVWYVVWCVCVVFVSMCCGVVCVIVVRGVVFCVVCCMVWCGVVWHVFRVCLCVCGVCVCVCVCARAVVCLYIYMCVCAGTDRERGRV